MRSALYQNHSRLITLGKTVTPLLLKNEYLGISEDRKTLKEAFVFLIQQYRDKVNIGKMSTATLNKYLYTQAKTQTFIQNKYHLSDILLSDIGTNFLSDLFHYLFTEQRLSNNTAMKYVSRVKTLFLVANGRGWMKSNLAATFKCAYEEESPNRLEMTELLILRNKHFTITRLEETRDCFVFMCYTGFAYADVRELSESNQFIGIDGEMWIAKHRKKTGANECVPLLPPALAIIEKYKDHPYCISKEVLLPIKSNQKFNGYLKEIADLCGIQKELSTHAARHTFATTVTLENDMPMETVSKMLGHRSLKTTQRYAKVTNKKISDNMQILKQKLFM